MNASTSRPLLVFVKTPWTVVFENFTTASRASLGYEVIAQSAIIIQCAIMIELHINTMGQLCTVEYLETFLIYLIVSTTPIPNCDQFC